MNMLSMKYIDWVMTAYGYNCRGLIVEVTVSTGQWTYHCHVLLILSAIHVS